MAKKTELRIKRFKNLTDTTMWCYTSEGELVEIPPTSIELTNGELPDPERGEYYIVSNGIRDKMLQDPRYINKVATGTFYGNSKDQHKLYLFEDIFQHRLMLAM